MAKYIVALILVASVAIADYRIVLLGSYTIEAGQTNTVETPYNLRGMYRQMAVWQDGEGVSTTTVYSVRNDQLFTLSVKTGAEGATKGHTSSSVTEQGLYDEKIRVVTVNYATNAITVTPAIIYDR